MHNKIVKNLNAVHVMAKSNFSSWIHSPRTLIMLLFVAAFCYLVTCNHIQSMNLLQLELHFGESLFFLLSNGCSITTTSILLLITISELPKQIGYQYSLLIRSSREKWLRSQILYCIWMACCMLTLTVICTSLFIIPSVAAGNGWSDTTQNVANIVQEHKSIIPTFIRTSFTPLSACLFAMLPMFLFWLTMIFVILLFSLYGVPLVGILAYGTMLVADVVLFVEAIGDFPMPIHFATLSNIIANANGVEPKKLFTVFCGYAVVISMILIMMFIRVRTTDLYFQEKE